MEYPDFWARVAAAEATHDHLRDPVTGKALPQPGTLDSDVIPDPNALRALPEDTPCVRYLTPKFVATSAKLSTC